MKFWIPLAIAAPALALMTKEWLESDEVAPLESTPAAPVHDPQAVASIAVLESGGVAERVAFVEAEEDVVELATQAAKRGDVDRLENFSPSEWTVIRAAAEIEGEGKEAFAEAFELHFSGEDEVAEETLVEELWSQPYALELFEEHQQSEAILYLLFDSDPYTHALHPVDDPNQWCRCESHGGVPTWEDAPTAAALAWCGERSSAFRNLIPANMQAH